MKPARSNSRPWWPAAVGVVIGIVGFGVLVNELSVKSTEISVVRSPDGSGYAVLLDVPQDAHRNHSARVCLVRSAIQPTTCPSIAYLSGVPAAERNLGIRLVWRGPAELEIRYRQAAATYLYYPTFTWPYTRNRTGRAYLQSLASIQVKLVPVDRFESSRNP